jgi:ABC-type sulfate transport system substrate-binding protein
VAWDGVVLTFRELTGKEATAAFNAANEKEQSERLFSTFRDTLVDHNIEQDGEKKSTKDVLDLLYSSSTVYTYCINTWSNSLPLAKANSGRSDKSEKT